MKWLNCVKTKVLLLGLMAAMVHGSGIVKADFTFGEPTSLGSTVNSQYGDACAFVSTDGLELYFASDRPPATPGSMRWNIWVSTRVTVDEDWGPPVNPGSPLNTSYHEEPECISADGLELYIDSSRPGGSGGEDLWVAKRKSKEDAWETPVNLGPHVNSSSVEFGAWISTDGLELYFNSRRAGGYGGYDLYVTRRATKEDPWGMAENLGPSVNSSSHEISPTTSDNGLWLLFSDYPNLAPRPGGFGGGDIWMITRATILDPWQQPVNIGSAINGSAADVEPAISPDGSKLYFSSTRPGGLGGNWGGDIYQAPIIPIVDFNGDGIVDIDDLVTLINNWGTDNTLCDIGPMPWGDGIVDESDLNVLMSYWGDDVNDPTLIANYKLDETEGDIACDSADILDGILNGNPTWQPSGGIIDGALELDGIDDYISTPFILNPRETSEFSVFAWIKGGLPGQTIISQSNGLNWLAADSAEGCLMTDLKATTRAGKELLSQVYITDEQWHRIGLVWDGSERILYVDDIEAARDAQTAGLTGCEGGLYIGAGSDLEPGSFFCGLIDDVRIYNRAITP